MKYTKVYLSILVAYLTILASYSVIAFGPVGENGFNVNVINDTITIRGYTVVANPNGGISQAISDTLFISKVSSSINSGLSCVNFNYTNGNQTILIPTNCTYFANYNYDVPFLGQNFSNQSQLQFIDTTTLKKYDECMNDKRAIEAKYQVLTEKTADCNLTRESYTKCVSDLAVCNTEKSPLNTKITDLQKQIDDNKNNWFWFVGGGALAGFVIAMIYTGRLGGPKFRTGEESYNPSGAS